MFSVRMGGKDFEKDGKEKEKRYDYKRMLKLMIAESDQSGVEKGREERRKEERYSGTTKRFTALMTLMMMKIEECNEENEREN